MVNNQFGHGGLVRGEIIMTDRVIKIKQINQRKSNTISPKVTRYEKWRDNRKLKMLLDYCKCQKMQVCNFISKIKNC